MQYTIEIYGLHLQDHSNGCKIVLTGTGSALEKPRRKLYIIHSGNDVLYVGEANTSLKLRFQRSCNSYNHFFLGGHAKNGYKGYKWLNAVNNKKRELTVTVAVFDERFDENRTIVEAIEAEVVHLIRLKYARWPEFQNEIHFSNCPGAGKIAEEIYRKMEFLQS